jgi:deoxyribonuclease V
MENKLAMPAGLRRWDVSPKRAAVIQEELRRYWIGKDHFSKIRTVAGLDAAFALAGPQALPHRANRWNALRVTNHAIGCVVMYRYPEMMEIERAWAILPLRFPYVPGLLSFREIPVLLAALAKLKTMPDLLFCDGQGYAHPRRMGLATHLGIVLDLPTIGCAKSRLIGTHKEPGKQKGRWRALIDPHPTNKERIGVVLRTRTGVSPIYVSQGHRVSMATARRLTIRVSDGLRTPRPTRDADRFAAETKREFLFRQLSEK